MSIRPLKKIQLDRDLTQPLWAQLSHGIRGAIREGALGDDEALPSESELISYFGISRTVVREALADLARSGAIYKIRAKGSFVAPPSRSLNFLGAMSGSADDIRRTGRSMSTEVLDQGLITPTAAQTDALDLSAGEQVVRFRRLRRVDGLPWLLVETALPARTFPGLERANLEDSSLYDHLRRQYGVQPARADRWFQAVLPNRQEAQLLETTTRTPLLRIESVAWDLDDRPIEYYEALHRSDEFRFHVGVR